jgi:hypothetical protein
MCTSASLAAALVAAACGGGGSSKPAETASGSHGAHADPSAAGEDEAEQDEPVEAAPTLARCDDGTCFVCGQGICPKGFYCDEQAVGGAACGWLPSCPTEPACSCVKRTLGASCGCEEREGGLYVSCK